MRDAGSSDPDRRFMVANDFTEAIERELIKDPAKIEEIVRLILRQLEDNNNEVTGNALRCITQLMKKLSQKDV
jgi:uncharacterized protein YpuA (DUF1002 family)